MRRLLAGSILALAFAVAVASDAVARDAAPAVGDGPPAAGVAGPDDCMAFAAALRAGRIAGRVGRVRDGDTIVVACVAVRLWGVHAPEVREPGGAAARRWMGGRAAGQVVVCDIVGGRSHDRLVAVCRDDAGDLAAQLIEAGLGRDCPRFSRGRYAGLETGSGRALPLPRYCETRPAADRRRPAAMAQPPW